MLVDTSYIHDAHDWLIVLKGSGTFWRDKSNSAERVKKRIWYFKFNQFTDKTSTARTCRRTDLSALFHDKYGSAAGSRSKGGRETRRAGACYGHVNVHHECCPTIPDFRINPIALISSGIRRLVMSAMSKTHKEFALKVSFNSLSLDEG
jgi:hypothetical protein